MAKRKGKSTISSPSKRPKRGDNSGTKAKDSAGSSSAKNKESSGGRWTSEEDDRLRAAVKSNGAKNWKFISKTAFQGSRSDVQCLHRWQKVLRPGLHKGPWTAMEDDIVIALMKKHGIGNIKWSQIAKQLNGRLGKQCRERWFNHLDPELKKGPWTPAEDKLLAKYQNTLGNKWREISLYIRGRSENSCKNRWNSASRKVGARGYKPRKNKAAKSGEAKMPLKSRMKQAWKGGRKTRASKKSKRVDL